MYDALRVGLAGGVAELHCDVERARKRHRSSRRGQRALQREPVEVLHDDVHRAVGELPDEEHVNDVRVRQTRRDLGLAVKAGDERGVRGQLAMQNFHGHVAIDSALKSPVDATHRADADELTNLDVPVDLVAHIGVRRGRRRDGAWRRRQRRSVERTKERVGGIALRARRARLRRRCLGGGRPLDLGLHGEAW